jgi:hypothetical protein
VQQTPKFCELGGGCKDSQRIYGIYNPKTNRLHRLTFSKSLALLIAEKTGLQIGRWYYHVGEALEPGQTSPSGLYALLDAKSNLTLRISLDPQIAAIHCDNVHRKLACAYLS